MNYYDFDDIKAAASGQWPEILAAFGIEYRAKEKAGPCPLCGGHDRAHYKESGGKVLLYCRHCGSHWADQLILELCFMGDFWRMCQELGHYLHCQPSERQEQVRTQAKIASAANTDIADITERMAVANDYAANIARRDPDYGSAHLIRYGIVSEFYESQSIDGALFPMTVSGKLVDWLLVDDEGERLLSGKKPAKTSRYVIKPKCEPGEKIFIAPSIIDALYLFKISGQKNIVICCGDASNIYPVAKTIPDKYRCIAAIPYTYQALDELMTISMDFIIPDEIGRGFCEIDYKGKPKKIYASGEVPLLLDGFIDEKHGD